VPLADTYPLPYSVSQVPVWFFMAADDPTVTGGSARTREAVSDMRTAGVTVVYTEYATGAHNITETAFATPPLVDWVMAQRRGQPSAVGPRVRILDPATSSPVLTSADTIHLSGQATNGMGGNISCVSWFNDAGAVGTATGTNAWSVKDLPLTVGTNSINVVATGPSWSSSLGGSTTFNAALVVIRLPPSPIVQSIATDGVQVRLSWTGGVAPFHIEARETIGEDAWHSFLTNSTRTVTLPMTKNQSYFRIMGR
jgi:hypothetical protein